MLSHQVDDLLPLTIGIKALNEGNNIAHTLEYAVAAARLAGGEVLLADSGSEDATVEIANRYPVRIVQLAHRGERCCGAGAQMAFQHARGRYFYLLDGDMRIDPDFLPRAIAYLDAHPDVAGVGGQLRERVIANAAFRIRARAQARLRPDGDAVGQLDGGGLYRRAAIESVGYFADRNLCAFEEMDLGLRLKAAGWRLARLPLPAVDHFGHASPGYALLWRRLRSGYAGGAGQLLRAALGKSHLPLVLRRSSHLRYALIVLVWWIALGLALAGGPLWAAVAALLLAPLLFLTIRRRSLPLALYTFVSWNVTAAATVAGFLKPRVDPRIPLATRTLADPPWASGGIA